MFNCEIVDETQLKDLVKCGFDYVRISFPGTSFDPIYVAFKQKPTKETISNLVASLYNNAIDNYIITGRNKEMYE